MLCRLWKKAPTKKTQDDIVRLANIALDRGDRHLLGEALRGDTPEEKAARKQLMGDDQFKNKLAEKFKSEAYEYGDIDKNAKFEDKVDHAALDYLTEGRISLATITSENTGKWIFNNEDNVSLAATNASQDERNQYGRGRDLALAHKDKDPSLTDQQKADVAFYAKIHGAFKDGGNDRQVSIWEDQLLHGKDSLITQLAKTHDDGWGPLSFGAGTNMNDAMSRVESMSADDFKRLQDPKYYEELKQSLRTYSDDGEYKRITDLIDRKLATGDFTQSQDVHRSLQEVANDNKSHSFLCFGTSYNGKNILDNIEHLTADDAKKYQTDEKFRKDINNLINDNLGDEEKLLAHRLLDQVQQTGKPADIKGDAESKFLDDKIHGADAQTLLADAQALLANPALRDRLNHPIDQLKGEDRTLKLDIQNALVDAYTKKNPMPPDGYYGLDNGYADPKLQGISDNLFKTGTLPLQAQLDLDFSKDKLLPAIAAAPAAERNGLRSQLTAPEQQVLDAVVANPNHQLTIADKMRLFVIGDGGNYSDFAADLDKLHRENKFNAIQDLKDEYAKKYHSDLNNDFLDKVSTKEKSKYTELLTPSNGDGRQPFYDNLNKLLREDGVTVDGTGLTMQRSSDLAATTLEEYQRIYQTLPRETQQALDKYFNDSLDQYKQSKEKLAEIASTALITAAALTVIVATGGTAAPAVLAAAFIAGGVTKNLVSMGIQGSDFDMSAENIAKKFVSGGVLAASNFVGGEFLGFGKTLGTIGETVAGDVIKDVGADVLSTSGKKILEESVPQMLARGGGKLDPQELLALAEKVAPAGASDVEKAAIARSIESSISKQAGTIDRLVNDPKYLQVLRGAFESGATGGVVNAGITTVDAALNGQPIDLKTLTGSALAGFAFGSVLHLGFSGVREGAKFFSVTKEPIPGGAELRSAQDHQYVKRGDNYVEVNKGDVIKDGDVPLKELPPGAKFEKSPSDPQMIERINQAKDLPSLKAAIADGAAHADDPAVRAAVKAAFIRELENPNTSFRDLRNIIADSKFEFIKVEHPDEAFVAALEKRAIAEVENNPNVFTKNKEEIDKIREQIRNGVSETQLQEYITNAINPALTPEEKAAALSLLSAENKPVVDLWLKKIDAEFGTESKSNTKLFERILQKSDRPSILADKPWYQVDHIRDSFRFKTVLNDINDLPSILAEAKAQGFEVIKADTDKVLNPKEWGWRIAAFDMRMPNGQLAEFYLPVKELEAVKGENHVLFEKWRNTDTTKLTGTEREAYQADLRLSNERYQAAWEAYLKRTGQTEEQVAKTMEQVQALFK